ncbi:MAG: L-histidine N(alpha)-methyltransferase [Flavobacterium sp.]|nr:L-histidine N(alpha)-methyltransferase [Pedobacter sp.]
MENRTELLANEAEMMVSKTETFLQDVLKGLNAEPKYLESKYFYDSIGDGLFQQIMRSPEYYPTNCELEIFSLQTDEITKVFTKDSQAFDLVELGAGDALKSAYLLQNLVKKKSDFTYYPIDISENVIAGLHKNLPDRIKGLKIHGLNGEYFNMLQKVNNISRRKKIVLFLGSNIGNMHPEDALRFCGKLRDHLSSGDLLLIGFDLKKDPQTILNAYNDKQGYTRDFNLNLLNRINKELGGNFNTDNFKHYPTYDPETGACKSYLVSTRDQKVRIEAADVEIGFEKNECIHTEISQKYDKEEIDRLAGVTGFTIVDSFYDSRKWFLDAVWLVG